MIAANREASSFSSKVSSVLSCMILDVITLIITVSYRLAQSPANLDPVSFTETHNLALNTTSRVYFFTSVLAWTNKPDLLRSLVTESK